MPPNPILIIQAPRLVESSSDPSSFEPSSRMARLRLTAEDEADLEGRWEYVNEGGMNMILRYKGPTKDRNVVVSSMCFGSVGVVILYRCSEADGADGCARARVFNAN